MTIIVTLWSFSVCASNKFHNSYYCFNCLKTQIWVKWVSQFYRKIGLRRIIGCISLKLLNLHCFIENGKYTHCSELWKHLDPVPGVRPMIFKAKLHKESKNGFKTINCHRYPVMFFSKDYFQHQKSSKKIGHFVDFWNFMSIYIDKLDQFKKI